MAVRFAVALRDALTPIRFVDVDGRVRGASQAADQPRPQQTRLGEQIRLEEIVESHRQAVRAARAAQQADQPDGLTGPRKRAGLIVQVHNVRPYAAGYANRVQDRLQGIAAADRMDPRGRIVGGPGFGGHVTIQPARPERRRQPDHVVADAPDAGRKLARDEQHAPGRLRTCRRG